MRYTTWRQLRCRRLDRLVVSRSLQQTGHGWRLDQPVTSNPPLALSRAQFSINHRSRSDPSFFSSDVDGGYSRPRQSQEAILDRAKVHGIDSLSQLDFESDLGAVRQHGVRLLDDASTRQDLDLWSVVLDYRQMRDGPQGIQSVLNAMLHGGNPVRLHGDSVSEYIWRTILPAVISDERLLYELCRIGSTFMQNRPFVFADVVGRLLAAGRIRLAIVFGTQLLISYFRGHSDLLHLFEVALDLDTEDAIQDFCQLIKRLPRYHIYDDIMPKLWAAGRVQCAFILHRQLLAMGDYPGDFEKVEPFIEELASRNAPLEPFLRELESNQISYSHQARRLYTQHKTTHGHRATTTSGKAFVPGPGTRPVKLSDAFVARTFATRSVSFDFVLSGLRFIGLFEIGPAAVREMALAANNLSEMQRRFEQLEKMEVDLGSSNYVRVISNLCRSGQENLLENVLHSDMHYEVFEDIQKQKRLLNEYYNNADWSQTRRTLAILNGGQTDKRAEMYSARLVAQSALIEGDWRRFLIKLDTIRELDQYGSEAAELAPLRLAIRRIWADVSKEERLRYDYLDRPLYLVGVMQQAQAAGLGVHPWQWRSVLHAVGRSGDWTLFHQLIHSVVRLHYDGSQMANKEGTCIAEQEDIVNQFLDSTMQSLVLEVSLIADNEDKDPRSLWLRGMRALLALKRKYRVDVDFRNLSNAFKLRLVELFKGTERGIQRRLVAFYVRQLNWAWSEAETLHDGNTPYMMIQQGLSEPDIATLRLFQLRSRSIWRHRRPVEPESMGNVDLEHVDLDVSDNVNTENQDGMKQLKHWQINDDVQERALESSSDTAVFYADLLHPSYQNRSGSAKSIAKSKRQI